MRQDAIEFWNIAVEEAKRLDRTDLVRRLRWKKTAQAKQIYYHAYALFEILTWCRPIGDIKRTGLFERPCDRACGREIADSIRVTFSGSQFLYKADRKSEGGYSIDKYLCDDCFAEVMAGKKFDGVFGFERASTQPVVITRNQMAAVRKKWSLTK